MNLYRYIPKLLKAKPALLYCSFKLTGRCTLNCRQCGIPGQDVLGDMSLENFEKVLFKLRNYGTRRIILSGGEPVIHSQFKEVVKLIDDYGFKHTHLLTNLYYSKEMQEEVTELLFRYQMSINTSYDGIGMVADYLRGGSNVSEIVERGMRMVSAANRNHGRPIKPTMTVILNAKNIHQLPLIIQRSQVLGWWLNIDFYRWSSSSHNECDELKLNDYAVVEHAINLIRETPNLRTPLWLYDGFPAYFRGEQDKRCPYLDNPALGSKFFIQQDGELHMCLSGSAGNILTSEIDEIFAGQQWQDRLSEFKSCPGCWNACYTITAGWKPYLHKETLQQMIRNYI